MHREKIYTCTNPFVSSEDKIISIAKQEYVLYSNDMRQLITNKPTSFLIRKSSAMIFPAVIAWQE